MIPTAGYDSYAVKGKGFYDPEADARFSPNAQGEDCPPTSRSLSGTRTSTTRPLRPKPPNTLIGSSSPSSKA